jgi:ribosomal protein S18 acetylase RimI-like enzyme
VCYVIKRAELHHMQTLPSIELAAAEMFSPEDLPQSFRTDHTSIYDLQSAGKHGRLWVAVDDHDIPVGFLMADIVDDNFHISEIDVHPDHVGRGIGTRLLHAALSEASARKYNAVTLTTFAHIPWNAPFYRSRGFSVMSEHNCGTGLSAILRNERLRGLKNRIAMCHTLGSV